jgi:putative membrane protein
MADWRFSKVSTSIMPEVLLSFVWALFVSKQLRMLVATKLLALTSEMWVPLSLQGTAIGLMLVFRTNSAYVCRYLCAFSWSLRDKLRDGDTRDDILCLLLSDKEAAWVRTQRSRPLAIENLLRRLFSKEYQTGRLDANVHNSLDSDLEQIDGIVESCERLFSSPIPPNMARHGLRSLTIWIMALPVVLAHSMNPLINGLWTAATAYIYLGVEELGCQVEQPFQIMPLWQLCHIAQLNVEEALSTPDHPLVIE